ncbi:MAG: acyl-CoA dehydrogenase [Marmoricola sp.]|nr:acyl-CoA dehydrogenase [Marmoricola sp.]
MALTTDELDMVDLVATFIDKKVRGHVREFEAENLYPGAWIEEMKEMGVYGLLIPEEYGGVGVSTECFARVTEELARGWMSLAGAMGGHSVITYLVREFGTPEQRETLLPQMASGELRATMALTEPGGGSDLQAMGTVATRDGTDGGYVVRGTKTWISNARRSGLFGLLCITDPSADPSYAGMSVLLVENDDQVLISKDLQKLGYKGIEACEVVFEATRVPASAVLGGVADQGWRQMMRGLEIGRIQVAARAVGVGQAALDDALEYAQVRESFGKPIWQHQAVGNHLAGMATKVRAARLLTADAAQKVDNGERADLEAGMAKLFASETAMEVALDAMRVHGGYGYSKEYEVERYFRDAPLMILGEGTNEVQKNVIAAQLVARAKGARR